VSSAKPIEPNIHRARRVEGFDWKSLFGMISAETSMKRERAGLFRPETDGRKEFG
jgi:hypothetical protein